MKKELEKSIEANAKRAANAGNHDDALKYSQAALNCAHALAIVTQAQKEGASAT